MIEKREDVIVQPNVTSIPHGGSGGVVEEKVISPKKITKTEYVQLYTYNLISGRIVLIILLRSS